MLEERTVNAVLYDALASFGENLSKTIVDLFQERGMDALAVGKEPKPNIPSVVVSDAFHYALIYLLVESNYQADELETFQRDAEWYAESHDATAYLVRIRTDVIPTESD